VAKPRLSKQQYSQAGPVTVRSLEAGEYLRTEDALPGGMGPGDTLKWWKDQNRRTPHGEASE